MTKTRLTGYDAITYAEEHDLLLNKHADPTEGAREDLSPDEAREIAAEDPSLIYLDIQPSVLTAEIDDDAIRVRDLRGPGVWYPDEDAAAEIRGELVVCESPDGYSIHAPGSTDAEIASGDAPPLVSGPWIDDEHIIPASAYDEARRVLAVHICEREPMRGTWQD